MCKNILSLSENSVAKIGIVRSAWRQVVFAPTSIMGFGFEDYDILQLADHALLLLNHGNGSSITGQLIRNLMEEGTLVETGMGSDPFDMPHGTIHCKY